ncbi:MAG: TetR/AcrR family transcriptional regulator [Pseudomonadota bacterium]
MRKTPVQPRAEKTIETIYEATAQILGSEGETALTTNRIAEKSGFSIGTLYQYFPSKEAIVLSMIDRERNKVIAELQQMLLVAQQQQPGQPLDSRQLLRQFIRTLIKAFGTGRRLKRTLVKIAWRLDHTEPIIHSLNLMAGQIAATLQHINDPELRPPSAASMYVVSRAVMGVIRSASMEDSVLLGTPEFENELVLLAWGMLKS